jgi:hypothetical protein
MSYSRANRGPISDRGGLQYDYQLTTNNDHVYYTITLYNKSQNFAPAVFTDNRNEPIIQTPQAFHFSVVSFTIDGMGIPIFIWPLLPTPPNPENTPNNTFYSVSLTYGGFTQTTYLIYTYFDTSVTIPWVFSYQHMVDMINTAYATAFTALAAKVGFPGYPAGITHAPYMTYDHDTGMFQMNFQAAYATTTVKAYMNGPLYDFFDNFEVLFNDYTKGSPPVVNPLAFQFIVKNNGNNRIAALDYPGSATISTDPGWAVRQETISLSLWNDAASIVFTSGLIPVNSELLAPAEVGFGTTNTSTNQFKNILIEFDIFTDDTISSPTRSIIQYFPRGEYRLVDLKGNTPLNAIDIQVYWKSYQQVYYPLYVSPNGTLQAKFMFRKREICE